MKCYIVGVHGNMGSGKDSLYHDFFKPVGYVRYAFATPLYEIAQMQYDIRCEKSVEYNKHCLHNKFIEIVGFVVSELPSIASKTHLYEDLSLGRKPREFLQYLGTDYFRSIYGEDVWCNYLTNKIISDVRKDVQEYLNSLDNDEDNLILIGTGNNSKAVKMSKDFVKKIYVSDIRFINEAHAVANLPQKINYSLGDMITKAKLIKLNISKETIIKRVNERDLFSEAVINKTLNHSSEQQLADDLFDIISNADREREDIYQELETKLEGFI